MTDGQEVRLYIEEARLGEATRRFIRSPIGEYLLGRAEIEMGEAKDRLVTINPYSIFARRKYARARHDYVVAQQFVRWLNDAIVNGDIALMQLEGLDDTDE